MNATPTGQATEPCRTISWVAAIVSGVILFLLAWKWLGWGIFPSLFVAVVLLLIIGFLLVRLLCNETEAPAMSAASAAASTPAPAPTPAPATKPAASPAPVATEAPTEKVAEKAPEKPAEKPAAKPAAKAKAKPAAKDAAKPAKKPAAKAASGAPAQPAKLDAPRGGAGDDLKQIKGVGPGLEKVLNGMGIWHFDQIAAWSKGELAWMDDNMPRFKGRASRDGWVDQAKKLAKGEETEFSSRVKKGDVY
jgi:predicted flap endonuclease-1-like 5' DNA nuclease